MAQVQPLSISIARPPADVYAFASDPRNLPMRVVPVGEGSEFVFTLIRRPGMSDQEFADDKAAVEKDLKTLKDLLETGSDLGGRRS